ncbi:hypothetical protein CHUAL_009340 [Chamberlinius hualienensis]
MDIEMDVDPGLSLDKELLLHTPFCHPSHGDMARLLLEAQRESNNSSAIGSRGGSPNSQKSPANSPKSPVSSPKSPANSPKSPPTTPDPEHLENEDDVCIINPKDIIENRQINCDDLSTIKWGYDWSSRPDQKPPNEWKLINPRKADLSIRYSKALKCGMSCETLSAIMVTSIASFIAGAVIGFHLGKRLSVQPVTLD